MNLIPSHSKQLSGGLKGKCLIRINLQHRLVYEIFEEEKMIKVLRFNCCFVSVWGSRSINYHKAIVAYLHNKKEVTIW